MSTVNISGLSRAAVLAALYNASRPLGMGFMHYNAAKMTESEAAELLKKTTNFDYLQGRVMKLSIDSDEIRVDLYNRDNGPNAAEFVIDELRKTGATSTPAIDSVHQAGKEQAAAIARKDMCAEPTIKPGVITMTLSDVKDELAPKIDAALKS